MSSRNTLHSILKIIIDYHVLTATRHRRENVNDFWKVRLYRAGGKLETGVSICKK